MILSGEKKEEYREVKMYWASRLCDGFTSTFGIYANPDFKSFDKIIFRNGYSKTCRTMHVEFLGIKKAEGKEEWGAMKGKKYFVIQLGKILSNAN